MHPTYDDYCDDTYAIKSRDDYIYKTCHDYGYPFSEHYSVNVETIYSIRVSYETLTIPNEKKNAYVESNKNSMLVDHEKNALCDGYIVEFIQDVTENYYEGGTYACRNCFGLFIRRAHKWARESRRPRRGYLPTKRLDFRDDSKDKICYGSGGVKNGLNGR